MHPISSERSSRRSYGPLICAHSAAEMANALTNVRSMAYPRRMSFRARYYALSYYYGYPEAGRVWRRTRD